MPHEAVPAGDGLDGPRESGRITDEGDGGRARHGRLHRPEATALPDAADALGTAGAPAHEPHRHQQAVILDLDGVLTRTATLHGQAWKRMFDEFLSQRSPREGEDLSPFDVERDYLRHVDGKPRLDGIRSFLASRGISIPEDAPGADASQVHTVRTLGDAKNAAFLALLEQEPVQTWNDAVEQVARWRARGIPTALVTSSRNGRRILDAAGLRHLFDVVIDGNDAQQAGLRGKPAPDIFVRAAEALGVAPGDATVVEDALSGVEAARAGGFGLVVGVARGDGAATDESLRRAGAHIVVRDLRELEARDDDA